MAVQKAIKKSFLAEFQCSNYKWVEKFGFSLKLKCLVETNKKQKFIDLQNPSYDTSMVMVSYGLLGSIPLPAPSIFVKKS